MSAHEWFAGITVLSPSTWIVHAVYENEWMGPAGGYAIPFPTLTDCLMWLRWHVLPLESCVEDETTSPDRVPLGEEAALVAATIDNALANGSTAAILEQIVGSCCSVWGGLVVFSVTSVHEFLSESDTVGGWRTVLGSEEITCDEGVWRMSSEDWDRLYEWMQNN